MRALDALVCGAFATASLTALPAAARIDFSTLPVGEMSEIPLPAEIPTRIAASSKVDGLYPAELPKGMRAQSPEGHVTKQYTLFSSRAHAESWAKRGHVAELDSRAASCFVTVDVRSHIEGREWPHQASRQGSVFVELTKDLKPVHPHAASVLTAVHVETLRVSSKKRATLDMVDGWLDARTGGVRLVKRWSMPLAAVADGPSGMKVWAARQGGKVHFVVAAPSTNAMSERSKAFVSGMTRSLQLQKGQTFGHSDCGHQRFTLGAKTAGGESATVRADVVISIENPQDEEKGSGSLGKVFDVIGVRREAAVPALGEIRTRSLNVYASVSQTASDPHPVPSVSFGWSGKPRSMAF